jgi:hypothetical protein
MFLTNRFFYNADNIGNGGGAGDGTITTELKPAAAIELPDDIKTELAELRALKQSIASKTPEKTPEEIQRENELEKVNFRKYAVEEKLMTNDDFSAYENVSKKTDRDLVYEKYTTEQKEDNPEITPEEIKENFESEYKLNSDNEKAKARGEQKIAKEAKELKTPFTSKYSQAENSYKELKSVAAKNPEFNAFIDEVIKENTPEKVSLLKLKEGEEEIPIETELTDDQRKEITKLFKTAKVFRDYLDSDGKQDQLKAKIAKKIDGFLKINNFEKVATKSFETGKGIGIKKGSNIGAENPFGLVRDINTPTKEQKLSANAAVDKNQVELREKIGSN